MALFDKKTSFALVTLLSLSLLISLGVLLKFKKELDSLTQKHLALQNDMDALTDKYSKRFWETCGGPFEHCGSFTLKPWSVFGGKYTHQKLETNYIYTLPKGHITNGVAEVGYGASIVKESNLRFIESVGLVADKSKIETCVADPVETSDITPETKKMFLKYSNIPTRFGILRLSWTDKNVNSNLYNLCQQTEENADEWASETAIGEIKLDLSFDNIKELDKIVNGIKNIKVTYLVQH